MMGIIEFHKVVKNYGEHRANDNLSFSVHPGIVFGIVGPNGSGKTTAINQIIGLLKPTEGKVIVKGFDPVKEYREVRKIIGLVPQETALYPELNALDNLRFFAALFMQKGNINKIISGIIDLVDLTHRAKDPVKSYSGGMKRRLAIGRALLHDPDIILLDEPTLGVDVQGSHKIWEYIRTLAGENKTILVTTNVMSEADTLCDELLIIDRGKSVIEGSPEELKKSIPVKKAKQEVLLPSLDDVFLHYTGHSLRD
jgi:ABC-2 type transport system ATP-binding protein